MVEIYTSNHHVGCEPLVMLSSIEECIEFIKKLHPDTNITTEACIFGTGKLVYINGEYTYFIG